MKKAFNYEEAVLFSKQIIGLMFSTKRNLLFTFYNLGRHEIHSFFVFFSFDAIYLDENMKVVEILRIKPFQVRANKIPAKYLLEIAEPNDIVIGDEIERIK